MSNVLYGSALSLIQSQACKVALVRETESHFRLSLTLSSRLFLLKVANFSRCSTGWQRHLWNANIALIFRQNDRLDYTIE